MQPLSREDGFTLPELLISTAIVLTILGTAMTTFKNAMTINLAATQTADANQNLRAGTNLLVRDLLQAARGIPTAGIPIPSGAGSEPIKRPSPPGTTLTFDNVTATHLPAMITGSNLGPTIDGEATDVVTFMMTDTLLGPLSLNNAQAGPPVVPNTATLAANGSSITVLTPGLAWLAGSLANGVTPIAAGDLIWLTNVNGSTLQTVTSVDATHVYFADSTADWFNFNQPAAAAGSVTQILPIAPNPMPQGTATRILMLTYYVDATTTPGTPRLTKVQNAGTPLALAGVVEDLTITYDLVDGVTNPTLQPTLPYTVGGTTYSSNQIRKVNLHIGVRSDTLSAPQNDYVRNHLSTVISIRSLAFVQRYP